MAAVPAHRAGALALFIGCLLSVSCSGASESLAPEGSAPESTAPSGSASDAMIQRLDAIDAAVVSWRSATDLVEAHAAAEAARNLVVGPTGPGYGDADGDGSIGGGSIVGLLPGEGGEPGLATDVADSACVDADVLGGSWADAAGRWATLQTAIDAWSPSNNTFPTLPSHPQRIVGWATLALATDDLSTAHEYGGHAALHSDISRRAVTDCDS
jgi:hypothetical protein